LNNLIKAISSIPENILKIIAFQALTGLEFYHRKTGTCYNCLSPSNILFDINYDLKVIKLKFYFILLILAGNKFRKHFKNKFLKRKSQ